MRILAVGVATIDIISLVDHYPREDSEVRALERHIRRGGNATNSLVALSQFGHRCSWCGTISDAPDSAHIFDDLARNRIETRYVVRHPCTSNPISCVTLSQESGSRSIVHYRRLPEYAAEDFSRVDLARFDWVHFEGRNLPQLKPMLQRLTAQPDIGCSLEVEKPRQGIDALFPLARVLMFSSAYARSRGYQDGGSFLSQVRDRLAPGAQATCAWGERGAWGMDGGGAVTHTPAFPPPRLVDTLGAGDVFNAGVIHGLSGGLAMTDALRGACRLAGKKCGLPGLEGLAYE